MNTFIVADLGLYEFCVAECASSDPLPPTAAIEGPNRTTISF